MGPGAVLPERIRPTRPWRPALAGILALSAALRFVNLLGAPGWHHDECVFVGQAWDFIHGRFVWDAVRHTFLPRLPLNYLTIGLGLLIFGKTVAVVRGLTALYGVLTSFVLYRIGKELGSRKAGLWAAFFFAVCPYCVRMNRWGFSYNLLALLLAAALLGGLAAARRPTLGRKALAAGAAAAAMFLEPLGVAAGVFVFALLLCVDRRRLWAWTLAMGAPIGGYAAFLLIAQRELFLDDVRIISQQRLAQEPPALLWLWFARMMWLGVGAWSAFGLPGLLAVRRRGAFRVIVLFLGALWLFLQKATGADPGLFAREQILLMPLACVGLAALAVRYEALWASLARERADGGRSGKGPGRWALGLAVGLLTANAAAALWRGLPNDLDHLCIRDREGARAAADYVARRVGPRDLVLTTHIGWMMPCRTASLMQMSLLEGGRGYSIFPTQDFRGRFVMDASLKAARFVVTDEATRGMAADVRDLPEIMERVYAQWRPIFRAGRFTVWRNPREPRAQDGAAPGREAEE